MPLPHEDELRELPSPVPTQTSFGFDCETATEPVDATGCFSKIASHVVPLFVVRKTPPVPVVTKIVYGSFSTTAKSETRPPMFAGPTERQRSGFVSSVAAGAVAAGAGVVDFVAGVC